MIDALATPLVALLSLLACPAPQEPPDVEASPVLEYLEKLELAERQAARGRVAQAAELYLELAEQNPDDPGLLLQAAENLAAANRYDEALPLAERALGMGVGNVTGTGLQLARYLAEAGRKDEAIAWIERVLIARYDNRTSLAEDSAFRSLRDDPRFRKLTGMLPEGELDRVAGWSFDLDHLVEEIHRMHADTTQPGRSPEFLARVEDLRQRVPELSDDRMGVEVQKLMVLLGDGHSSVQPVPGGRFSFAMLPVRVYFFSDGLFVIEGRNGTEDLVGSRIVTLGGRTAADLRQGLADLVSRDNEQQILWLGPLYLIGAEPLRALGCEEKEGGFEIVVEDQDGVARKRVLTPGRPYRSGRLTAPDRPRGDRPTPLWLTDPENPFWMQDLPDLDALYVQVNQIGDGRRETLDRFAGRVRETLAEGGATHLVLDLRHNNGGNNFLIWPLVRTVAWFQESDSGNTVHVLTGRSTFSACQNLLNYLTRVCGVVVAGEPSSSRPIFVGESTQVRLPWSGLNISISSRYWQDSFPWDRRQWIAPRIPVRLSSSDYFGNRDPVMEAVAAVIERDLPVGN